MTNKPQRGFTLIEILLVIAVIAVIASLAILTYRGHSQTTRIEKSALELQQVLEAALAYNADQAQWPANNSALPSCTPTAAANTFVNGYLPNARTTDAFGANYCWSKAGTSDRLFWVAIPVPGNDQAMAKRIAARLPNAIITSDPTSATMPACVDNATCYVRSEVAQPGLTTSNVTHEYVATSGSYTCSKTQGCNAATQHVTFKACAPNTTPHIYGAPTRFQLPTPGSADDPGFILKEVSTSGSCNATPDASGNQSCDMTVNVSICATSPSTACVATNIFQFGATPAVVGASYTVMCVPNATALKRAHQHAHFLW